MVTFVLLGSGFFASAQVCDPSVAPTGLTTTYTPGTGVLLEWDAIPGSVGAQFKVVLPSGASFSRQIMGFEPGQFAVPDVVLSSGNYTWRVRAACSETMPYDLTPVSESHSFTIGGGSYCPATVTDIDGNVYNVVVIGDQCWTQENLKVERYRNGDSIPTGLSNSAWSETTSGAFAVSANVPANKLIYGLLYNWYAVDDPRGLCPTGWHVPTDAEWTQMITVLDPTACGTCTGNNHSIFAGGKMKTTGTLSAGTGLWQDPNTAATNNSGFSGLPSSHRNSGGLHSSVSLGLTGYWWSSSPNLDATSPVFAHKRYLRHDYGNAFRSSSYKQFGFSVRCLRD